MIEFAHQWIRKLEAESSCIAGFKLESDVPNAPLKNDALNFANCEAHCRLICRAAESLAERGGDFVKTTRDLLANLLGRGTYDAFAELAVYFWLSRCFVPFRPQVPLSSAEVLGRNGSTLDGKIERGPFFDVKAFGFNGRLAAILRERLSEHFPDKQILVTESWDVPISVFDELLSSVSDLAAELGRTGFFRSGNLHVRLQEKQLVTVSMRRVDAYRLARKNALFPFQDAKQFTRNKSFVLIFVVHPWLGEGILPTLRAWTRNLHAR